MSSSNLQKKLIQIWAFVFKNWIMTKRNVFSLFEILFWPVVGFLSVGLLTNFLKLEADMSGFILIGIISMSVTQVCQIDVAYVLLYDLWSKSIKHRSEEHTSELQSRLHLVCRLLLEKQKKPPEPDTARGRRVLRDVSTAFVSTS